MEQIRIVKELREHDLRDGRPNELVRPRFLVWENVPGALSSGTPKGEDFRIVLEEVARVKEPGIVVPRPQEWKWPNAGYILGNDWSIAWRILDLQYWGCTYFDDEGVPTKLGTPQRRRRIALVADYAAQSAPEILFERESLLGHFEPSEQAGKGPAGDPQGGPGGAGESFTLKIRGGREVDSFGKRAGKGPLVQEGKSGTLGVSQDQTLFAVDQGGGKSSVSVFENTSPTLSTTHDGAPVVNDIAYGIDQQGGKGGANYSEDTSPPILSDSHGTPHAVAYGFEPGASTRLSPENRVHEETAPTLRANMGDNQPAVAAGFYPNMGSRAHGVAYEDEKAPVLSSNAMGVVHTHTAYAEKRFFEWHEDDTSVSLRANSGSYGGGSECLIAERNGGESPVR